jgi:photosystem II stability/assembly factor-like uncharacterized protein
MPWWVKKNTLILLFTLLIWNSGDLFSKKNQDKVFLPENLFENIAARFLGPVIYGGRINVVKANPQKPWVIYVGAASGGVFKSINNGTTWMPIFDDCGGSLSIGDIALSPFNEDIIWVGTGESNGEQEAASLGNGVFKSSDGGKTWQEMGLKKTQFIGRIAIHPKNDNVVFAAALGNTWGNSPDRGLFRTKNGGQSWEKVLFISEKTGVVDVAIDANGTYIYAISYQRQRSAWGNLRKGPESGVYRSRDGGDTWEKLTKGLPTTDIGKMGLAVSPSHPQIVYLVMSHPKAEGVYRSDDHGEHWQWINKKVNTSYWYGQIRVDPKNPDKVWVPEVHLWLSTDGGRTFSQNQTYENVHVDHHDIWINPIHTDHLILGNDGGLYMSYDSGKNWLHRNNLPIGQLYHVSVDQRTPYWIYGGTQDNGTWGIPSRSHYYMGIFPEQAIHLTGGDGFFTAVAGEQDSIVFSEYQYGGLIVNLLLSAEKKSIKPVETPNQAAYRFHWCSPFLLSPHDSHCLYFGANKLLKTTDYGDLWQEISGDLSSNPDLSKRTIMGLKPVLKEFGTILAISESPFSPGHIMAGTDDGNLQLTENGGKEWLNLSSKIAIGEDAQVTAIAFSVHQKNRAYVSFTRHMSNDFQPYLYQTPDNGKTWHSLSKNLPKECVIQTFLEHPNNQDLLFIGYHRGVMISINQGQSWVALKSNIPPVSIKKIVFHPKTHDLILASYGRGIIVIDDISFLETIQAAILKKPIHLFAPLTVCFGQMNLPYALTGSGQFIAQNPMDKALITYFLNPEGMDAEKSEAVETFCLEIYDQNEHLIRRIPLTAQPGIQRIGWNLQCNPVKGKSSQQNVFPWGLDVLPGNYTIRLRKGDYTESQPITIMPDPSSQAAMEDQKIVQTSSEAKAKIRSIRDEIERIFLILDSQENETAAIKKLSQDVRKIDRQLKQLFDQEAFSDFYYINLYYGKPTTGQQILLEKRTQWLKTNTAKLNEIIEVQLPGILRQLQENNIKADFLIPQEIPDDL